MCASSQNLFTLRIRNLAEYKECRKFLISKKIVVLSSNNFTCPPLDFILCILVRHQRATNYKNTVIFDEKTLLIRFDSIPIHLSNCAINCSSNYGYLLVCNIQIFRSQVQICSSTYVLSSVFRLLFLAIRQL